MYYFTTICAGSSIDMQILTDLFGDYIAAAKVLGLDQAFSDKVAGARSRLVPPQIGADGMLQEWADDFQQLEPKHRHISLLYGVYPGNVISLKRTPALIAPVKKVLEERGDEGAGFSRAWKMCVWARLNNGNRAYNIFKGYLDKQAFPQLFAKCFTPMQVDGSLGVTAAITEMLIQSQDGEIDLLPALPDEWQEGKFEGVCARGAFTVNFEWKDRKITKALIISNKGGLCRLNAKRPVSVTNHGKKVITKNAGKDVVEFLTKRGGQYEVIVK
jgi:alpha-L-fucosidase 2